MLNPYLAIDWRTVCHLLKLDPPKVFPGVIECPLCGSHLTLHDDHVTGGSWATCHGCGFCGNPIQLCARTWRLQIQDTVARIARLTSTSADFSDDELIRKYLIKSQETEEHYRETWHQSKRPFETGLSSGQAKLLSAHTSRYSGPKYRWSAVMGDLVGMSNAPELNKLFSPTRINANTFPEKCRDIMVVPFLDAPGRVCGFYCVFEQGKENKKLFRTVGRRCQEGRQVYSTIESGLAWLDTILQIHSEFVLAVSDPLFALGLQSRHANHAGSPLPITAWRKGEKAETFRSWRFLADRKVCFLAQPNMGAALIQAIYADGYISSCSVDEETDADFFRRRTPESALSYIFDHAVFWVEVVSRLVAEDSEKQLRQLASLLEHNDYAQSRLSQELGTASLQKIINKLPAVSKVARVSMGRNTYVRTGDSLLAVSTSTGKPHLAANVFLMIDEIITITDCSKVLYRGRIRHRGTEIHFVEDKQLVDSKTAEFIDKLLLRHHAGVFQYDAAHVKNLVQVSFQLHPPVLEEISGRVGWCPRENCLKLPRATFDVTGITRSGHLFGDKLPGKTIVPSQAISRATVEEAFEGKRFCYIDCVIAFLENISAVARQQPRQGIICPDDSTESIVQSVARGFDCLSAPIRANLDELLEMDQTHEWPILAESLSGHPKWSEVSRVLRSDHNTGIVLVANELTARCCHVNGNWRLVRASHEDEPPTDHQIEILPTILANYLPELLKSIPKQPVNVRDHFLAWTKSLGMPLRASKQQPRAESFAAVMKLLLNSGNASHDQLEALDKRSVASTELISINQAENKGVWINKSAINKTLDRQFSPRLSDSAVISALSGTEYYQGELLIGTAAGWLVSSTWLSSLVRRDSRIKLKVIA